MVAEFRNFGCLDSEESAATNKVVDIVDIFFFELSSISISPPALKTNKKARTQYIYSGCLIRRILTFVPVQTRILDTPPKGRKNAITIVFEIYGMNP
jgi:hypothetical protein